jgi:hypothetical protein
MQQETLNHHHAENRIRADGQAARQRLGTLAKQKYGDLVDDADIREQEDWIFREVFQGNEVLYYTAINTPAMQEMVARLAVGARAAKAKGQPRTQGAASARRPASGNQAAPPVRAKAPSNWWEDPAELAAAAFAGTRGNPAKKGGKR